MDSLLCCFWTDAKWKYSISSPSLLIRFSFGNIHIYIVLENCWYCSLWPTKWNFAYLPHFITLDMGIFPPSTELCSIPKTAYGDDLVFGIIRLKRRETIHIFAPRSERLMNDFPFYRRRFLGRSFVAIWWDVWNPKISFDVSWQISNW